MDDSSATVNELKCIVQEFCEARDWDQFHNPKDLAIGIATEASELLEIFRFKNNDESAQLMRNPKKRQIICEELSDTLYFILRFAQMNDIDLYSELKKKIEINNEKYPVEKTKGSNKKYNEYQSEGIQ